MSFRYDIIIETISFIWTTIKYDNNDDFDQAADDDDNYDYENDIDDHINDNRSNDDDSDDNDYAPGNNGRITWVVHEACCGIDRRGNPNLAAVWHNARSNCIIHLESRSHQLINI